MLLGVAGCATGNLPGTSGEPPRDRAATFHSLGRGVPPEALTGADSRWTSGADAPARVEATPQGLELASLPGRRAWASPRLPVAPLGGVPEGHVEEITWEADVTVEERFFIVCELRFAGEPGAVLVQATPFDIQVLLDVQRPTGGGRSESVSRIVDTDRAHLWRVRVAGGRLDLRLDGTTVWSLDGPRALSRLAFGETRTDDEHGGVMRLRDLVYVRRPAH